MQMAITKYANGNNKPSDRMDRVKGQDVVFSDWPENLHEYINF
jgi:hypothetical protein